MLGLFDELSELVYISDPETYELLYLNEPGRQQFGVDTVEGCRCYELLQGRDTPCGFCTNARLTHERFITWEFTNPISKRHYLLKDKLIKHQGRDARVEIAFDISEKENQQEMLRDSLRIEEMVLGCVRVLHLAQDTAEALQQVLAMVGDFLQASRVYIFELREMGMMDNTFEWCAKGVSSQRQQLQGLDTGLIGQWKSILHTHQTMVIEDVESLKGVSPQEYDLLVKQQVKSLVVSPLALDGDLIGFLGVDDPPAAHLSRIVEMLNALGYFVEATLRRQRDKLLLEKLSYHDILTGAMNRNAFMRDIRPVEGVRLENVGVVYLDVNGMKDINDKHGHLYGDAYLSRIIKHARTVFRKEALYRVGGDEFIVISRGVEEDEFLKQVRELTMLFSGGCECSASVGYQWAADCADVQDLIFEADEVMYAAKKEYYRAGATSGRYRHGNDDILGMTKPGVLQKLLEEKRFVLYYQPKVSIETREVIGAEALVRYIDSEGELVYPDQFIPTLEDARMISALDFYVFEEACRRLSGWRSQGKTIISLSVNFSRYSLAENNFAQKLFGVFQKYHLDQKLIKIEVTESVEEEDRLTFLNVVEEVRSLGFSVSIDDFGVRHANLALFASCDFDELKIDRSLIIDLERNEKAQAIIQSVSDICRRMGVQLIVEGVETEEQARILNVLNCHGAQGYLFSRPLALDDFERKFTT